MAKISYERPEAKTMVKGKVSKADFSEFLKVYETSKPFVSNVWALHKVVTLEQFAEGVDPKYKKATSAYIIAKRRNDNGKIFCKMAIAFGENRIAEWELTYAKKTSYGEGDMIDLKTVLFCIEVCGEKKHLFAEGEIL